MSEVRLPDLDVIRRYSIAVRQEHAPAEEVAEALRADLDRVERALRGRGARSAVARDAAPRRRESSPKGPVRRKPKASARAVSKPARSAARRPSQPRPAPKPRPKPRPKPEAPVKARRPAARARAKKKKR
ncbi:MAG: hypothetical protein HY775_09890 [Acidobacteria bacterium]|nr:hypothetical protein [Acidobacteriota bacterium]